MYKDYTFTTLRNLPSACTNTLVLPSTPRGSGMNRASSITRLDDSEFDVSWYPPSAAVVERPVLILCLFYCFFMILMWLMLIVTSALLKSPSFPLLLFCFFFLGGRGMFYSISCLLRRISVKAGSWLLSLLFLRSPSLLFTPRLMCYFGVLFHSFVSSFKNSIFTPR